MGLFGPPNIEKLEAKRDVKGLIKALRDKNDAVRVQAAQALGRLGDTQAVEPLIDALKDSDALVRLWAVKSLGALGDLRAVEPLIATLKDSSEQVLRYCAADELGKIGGVRAVEALIAALQDSDKDVRYHTALALEALHWQPAVDESGAWYWMAKRDWDQCVEVGSLSVEPLLLALKDSDKKVRFSAAGALEELHWQPGADENGAWYWIARRNWEKCKEVGAPAVEPLIALLKDKDASVFSEAAFALGSLNDARAVEPLIDVLQHHQGLFERECAAHVLIILYRKSRFMGTLDEATKHRILQMRPVIAEIGTYTHHTDEGDYSDGSGHTDENVSNGIDVGELI